MIELKNNRLVFSFPEVHSRARISISFKRTLRIPDDGKDYPLPAGIGTFPMQHVDDFKDRVPPNWSEHGGVMLPMYQSEAMWINFDGYYPFAIKVAAGKINAVSGEAWRSGLHRTPQDYMVTPDQPWLDGYSVEKGIIRQFVAEPFGLGYTAEEQITGKAETGGIQIAAYPMKRASYDKYFPPRQKENDAGICYSMRDSNVCFSEMGLAPGGRMKQEIMEDTYEMDDWDIENTSRSFIHICNSMTWRQITGVNPPSVPLTNEEYAKAGIPWYLYYDESVKKLPGSATLAKLKSLGDFLQEKKGVS